jgi:hypothetical protein
MTAGGEGPGPDFFYPKVTAEVDGDYRVGYKYSQ